MKKPITIYTEANPNPNSLKFVVNRVLTEGDKTYDFPDENAAINAPLALELFGFDHVQRVFIASNFITITKNENADWEEMARPLREFIQKYLEEDHPVFLNGSNEGEDDEGEDDETVKKIKAVLDEYIKPAVEMDGGAITFHSFDNGTVKVLLQGACSGCPSSTITLKQGIENLLTRMVPGVKEVVAEGV